MAEISDEVVEKLIGSIEQTTAAIKELAAALRAGMAKSSSSKADAAE